MKAIMISPLTKALMVFIMIGFSLNGALPRAVQAASIDPGGQVLSVEPQSFSQSSDNPALLEETSSYVTLELIIPGFEVVQQGNDNQSCQVFKVQNFTETQKPGYPQLPEKTALIGIPWASQPSLVVLETDQVEVDGQFNLCPAVRPVFEYSNEAEIHYLGEQSSRDLNAYSQDSFYPQSPANLSSTAMVRSQHVAQVSFQPFQYNPMTGKVRYFERIRVRVFFNQPGGASSQQNTPVDEGIFEDILSKGLVNGQTAAGFRSSLPAPSVGFRTQSPESGQPWVKLFFKKSGLAAVSYEILSASGADISTLTPNTLQVFNQDSEVSSFVTGDQDGSFDPGDQVIFHAESVETRYSDTNVYWLTWGNTTGLRMSTLSSAQIGGRASERFLANKHLETNIYYRSTILDTSGDHWFWSYINANGATASASYPFSLSYVDSAYSASARLRGSLFSDSAMPRNHAKIYMNDNYIGEGYWTPGTQYNFDFQFPMSYLVDGGNTVRIDLLCDGNITYNRAFVNWFDLDYWRAYGAEGDSLSFNGEMDGTYTYEVTGFSSPNVDLFDLTNPKSPIRITDTSVQPEESGFGLSFKVSSSLQRNYQALTSSQYLVPTQVVVDSPSNLKSSTNGADYLLISHSSFISSVQPLAEWRANQGLRVSVIDVQDIYDEFNGGVFSPDAIRDFIAYAYENWQQPAPQFVLLVGDGHFDPRNFLATNDPIFIPAYLHNIDPFLGETASDNRYVTVRGTDNLADLLIGRLSVRTSAEASAVVSKIIGYEQSPVDVDWNGKSLFITDNPDSAGNYYYYSDLVANSYIPDGYTANKVYYGSTHTTTTAARTAILDAINQGTLIVNYVGHGSAYQLASEALFQKSSLSSLNNASNLPLFSMLACLTGYFHYPNTATADNTSLAEAVVKSPARGAVASWGSSGMGVMEGQDFLNRGLFQALFYEGQNRVGAAALQAKLFLYSQSSWYPDLQDTYTLFGDPALKLNVRPSDLSIHLSADPVGGIYNGMPITYTLSYENIGMATASQVQIDHPLPLTVSDPVVTLSDPEMTQLPNSRLSWTIPQLAPGQSGTITVRGVIDLNGTGQISSQATIYSPIADLNTENNFAGPIQTEVLSPTAIDLAMIYGTYRPGQVLLEWETASELTVLGFQIDRKVIGSEEWVRLTESMIPSLSYGSLIGNTYKYEDNNVPFENKYVYRIAVFEEAETSYHEIIPLSTLVQLYLPFASR